jgi:hypothetical protein
VNTHESHLVAFYDDGTGLRYATDQTLPECRISVLQVACSCGWRSQRLRAPDGTVWRPFAVTLPPNAREGAYSEAGQPTFGDHAQALWAEHCSSPLLREIVPE